LLILGHELSQRNGHRVLYETLDREFPVGDLGITDLRYRPVVANVEKLRAREEAFIKQVGKRCFNVERMYAAIIIC
jgi:hypothetical protein